MELFIPVHFIFMSLILLMGIRNDQSLFLSRFNSEMGELTDKFHKHNVSAHWEYDD